MNQKKLKEVKMSPLINWEELRQLTMPPGPPPSGGGEAGNLWDNSAEMYNQISQMEKSYTLNQINAFETTREDTVLDIGCGAGRIAIPMAQRAKSVTAIDSAEKMLAFCRQNAAEAGANNLNIRRLDWQEAVLDENLEAHDIVIASRSPGMTDLKKTCSFAKKYVVLIAWANAPNIPAILGDLFKGVNPTPRRQRPPPDRRLSYNITYNQVYDMGYEPNIRIVKDGFSREYASREAAYRDLWRLREAGSELAPQFKRNVDQWLTENEGGGVTFRRETRSFVMWWETQTPKQ
jgi:SAM-dependent methyltransferase